MCVGVQVVQVEGEVQQKQASSGGLQSCMWNYVVATRSTWE